MRVYIECRSDNIARGLVEKMTIWSMRTHGTVSVYLYLICVLLQFAEFSLELCSRRECEPRIDTSTQPGKNVTLCLDNESYTLSDIFLLENGHDGLDSGDCPSSNENDTHKCTVVNTTRGGFFHDGNGGRTCRQLMVIQCVKRVPTNNRGDDSDDSKDGNGCNSDSGNIGCRGDRDEGDVYSLTMGLLLNGSEPSQLCYAFVNVTMREHGKSNYQQITT